MALCIIRSSSATRETNVAEASAVAVQICDTWVTLILFNKAPFHRKHECSNSSMAKNSRLEVTLSMSISLREAWHECCILF